ncbi:Muskelin N-terminus-domain-containing protein [Hysterangium stoloniferum]|nr:Muskelin N-terminus-domain-containing protein [Hysterangium stoloniferum]
MTDITSVPSVPLGYSIVKCTGHSGKYAPEHILVNNPTDPSSRWSGAIQTANHQQWLILELASPSLVRNIMFGKHYKEHPCNMKGFKVYVGRTIDSLSLVLHADLMNNSTPETFKLARDGNTGPLTPIRYIKIVPLSAHKPSFHISIWHVALLGVADATVVQHAEKVYETHRETSALLHVLKYLRQRRYISSFRALLSRTSISLEHPILTMMHDNMILGNWSAVESLIQTAADEALFDVYIQKCDPKAVWHRLSGTSLDGDIPSQRGGHQMCIDPESDTIYLFGGWDGQNNLDDLWSYSIFEGRWKLLSSATALDHGPGPRSCHKMVLDPLTGYIYVLGRVGDVNSPSSGTSTQAPPTMVSTLPESAVSSPPQGGSAGTSVVENGLGRHLSDFYRYATRGLNAGQWTLLSPDTAAEGGPPLIYDHQLAIDSEKQMLYVFGGRIVQAETDLGPARFSGLYQYNIVTGKWEHLMHESGITSNTSRTIPVRYGHSMVFDPKRRRLIVLAGKTHNDFLPDTYIYDVDSHSVVDATPDFSAIGGPDPCFCQRAVLNPESGHVYVLPGFIKPKGQKTSDTNAALRSVFWIFKPESSQWTQIAALRALVSSSEWEVPSGVELEPQPRYAHEMVYDTIRGEFFVHGGNSGQESTRRLDDFWSMKLEHPARGEVIRRAKFITRRQQFKELCESVSPVQALTFLQRDVHAVVDHFSEDETTIFRGLHSHLFDQPQTVEPPGSESGRDVEMIDTPESDYQNREAGIPSYITDPAEDEIHAKVTPSRFQERTRVFEDLLKLVNTDAKQPPTDIIDLMDGAGREHL